MHRAVRTPLKLSPAPVCCAVRAHSSFLESELSACWCCGARHRCRPPPTACCCYLVLLLHNFYLCLSHQALLARRPGACTCLHLGARMCRPCTQLLMPRGQAPATAPRASLGCHSNRPISTLDAPCSASQGLEGFEHATHSCRTLLVAPDRWHAPVLLSLTLPAPRPSPRLLLRLAPSIVGIMRSRATLAAAAECWTCVNTEPGAAGDLFAAAAASPPPLPPGPIIFSPSPCMPLFIFAFALCLCPRSRRMPTCICTRQICKSSRGTRSQKYRTQLWK